MPTPISALQKGLKFESTSGRATSPNLKLENLTLSSSGSVFMPDGATTADLLNATAGGVLITVNPPIAKVNTHKDLSTDYTFADGHNDINIVGILVGDLVK